MVADATILRMGRFISNQCSGSSASAPSTILGARQPFATCVSARHISMWFRVSLSIVVGLALTASHVSDGTVGPHAAFDVGLFHTLIENFTAVASQYA